ncbi:MAG: hypothetical protein Q7S23_00405 [bacterium]|nr:hypothetical protein [bacterium]
MCGVAGYIGPTSDAAAAVLRMMIEIEGRGPHSAGLAAVTADGLRHQNRLGSASHLAQRIPLDQFHGRAAIGHVRYATAGSLEDAQPLVGEIAGRRIAIAVNGDTVTIHGKPVNEYRKTLQTVYRARSDTETLLHLIAQTPGDDLVERIQNAFCSVEGAWSMIALIDTNQLVAIRDPWAFRPLLLACGKEGFAIASEDCAFSPSWWSRVREIRPGELLCIGADLVPQSRQYRPVAERLYRCSFEDVYLKSPGSRGVFLFRTACGNVLAEEMLAAGGIPAGVSAVVAMLDSGRDAANAFAHRLGLPVMSGINRTRLGRDVRTFLGHSENDRLRLAAQKHLPNPEVLQGRDVLLVDDSIVRGDTLGVVIKMMKAAGCHAIHVAIASPRVTGACYYGIATPTTEQLIAAQATLEETCQRIGAASLRHLSIPGFQSCYAHLSIVGFRERLRPGRDVCDACMTGDYPPFVPPAHTTKRVP